MSLPTASGPVLFTVDDPLADRLEDLQRTADEYRATAADYLRAADGAEQRARALSAYRHAQAAFIAEPRALELVDQLGSEWRGDGGQLVNVIRSVLHAVGRG